MSDSLPNPTNLAFVEDLYEAYLDDPQSVDATWRSYFEGYKNGAQNGAQNGGAKLGPSFKPKSLFGGTNGHAASPLSAEDTNQGNAALQQLVGRLVRNYRVRGHITANIDPLGMPKEQPPELDPAYYNLTDADMERKLAPDTIPGMGTLTLREVIDRLQNTYCRSIGAQFMHIDDLQVRKWLQRRMETSENRLELSHQQQTRILTKLTDAVIFEEFIQKKYLGAKSFSLEGGESLIPLLELAIDKAGAQGVEEVVLGMAHRGRLNVLANIMGKSPKQIFREFEDKDPELHRGRGDVKYHLGYSSDWTTDSGEHVHLSLCFNPSHLEFVNPVAMGRVRAKQDRIGDSERECGLAILIHGDAAFIGEGVVQETLNMSELPGYHIGGALHVILNNQLGFTTGPKEGRSSPYASDVAKMLQIPIFHVNGEDPEAVAQVINLAMDFRREFSRDVVIDMYSYRKHGHNEGDEPSFTQPLMYEAIRSRKGVREAYSERLLTLGEVTQEEVDEIAERRREDLETELSAARSDDYTPYYQAGEGLWKDYVGGKDKEVDDAQTGVAEETLVELLKVQTKFPEDFHPHPKIARAIQNREKMAQGERPIDWASAESLAFGSLLMEGHRVRMSGQDSVRGTFSQRHAGLYDVEDGHMYMPLRHLNAEQAPIEIYNSPLSEAGVLGFEYGYSLDFPDGLTLWEAQYGDFNNAAQVIIDQFIASAEDKWRRLSGLVMLLPHGFEGSGPEHSSARLERFLTLCAEDNMQVMYPTTAAQYFHLLRRQVLRRWRKPLVMMTPKSLLRNQQVSSSLDALVEGEFQRVIPDNDADPQAVKRVLLCSGKVYYDLMAERENLERHDVAIVRLEQLYPLSEEDLQSTLASYADGVHVVWVQEEPENMGAWQFLRFHFGTHLFGRSPFSGVTRPASASPATGSGSAHKLEQAELLKAAFASG